MRTQTLLWRKINAKIDFIARKKILHKKPSSPNPLHKKLNPPLTASSPVSARRAKGQIERQTTCELRSQRLKFSSQAPRLDVGAQISSHSAANDAAIFTREPMRRQLHASRISKAGHALQPRSGNNSTWGNKFLEKTELEKFEFSHAYANA